MCFNCTMDIDGDQSVGVSDVLAVLSVFGEHLLMPGAKRCFKARKKGEDDLALLIAFLSGVTRNPAKGGEDLKNVVHVGRAVVVQVGFAIARAAEVRQATTGCPPRKPTRPDSNLPDTRFGRASSASMTPLQLLSMPSAVPAAPG